MGNATVLNKEQMDLLSSDLAELIEKITTFEEQFDVNSLKKDIKDSVLSAIADGSLVAALQREDFELEQNLKELKKVKKHFIECQSLKETKTFIISFVSVLLGAGIATFLIKFF
uniref:hypothetical protein n=1 Tax=Aliarcobacter sp. TaxID=2321116 RepID=UPI0040480EA6